MLPEGGGARDAGSRSPLLEPDLDLKGLRAQVLERIEVLEEREREKQELLAKLVLAMKTRGYDTGAINAVVGG